jgi:hypothetical protein
MIKPNRLVAVDEKEIITAEDAEGRRGSQQDFLFSSAVLCVLCG